MACHRFRDDLSGFVDGTLAVKRWEEVAKHLASCPLCREEAAELRELRERLSSARVPASAAPSSLASRLEAIAGDDCAQPLYLPAGAACPLPSRRRRKQRMLARAAAVGFSFVAGVLVLAFALAPEPRVVDNAVQQAREQFARQATAINVQGSVGAVLLAQGRGAQLRPMPPSDAMPPPHRIALPVSDASAEALLRRAGDARVRLSGIQLVQITHDAQVLGAEVGIERVSGEGAGLIVYDRVGERFLTSFAPDFGSADQIAPSGWTYFVYPSRAAESGRDAQVLEARSGEHAVARWWLDNASGITLRSERYDTQGKPTISVSFRRLLLGEAELPEERHSAVELSRATASGQRGWCVGLANCPYHVAGLPLVGYSSAATGERSMTLVYSDGVNMLSVVWVEGQLAGRERKSVPAATGLPSVEVWQSATGVISVATNGSPRLLSQAVGELPEESDYTRPVWERLGDGLRRIVGFG